MGAATVDASVDAWPARTLRTYRDSTCVFDINLFVSFAYQM